MKIEKITTDELVRFAGRMIYQTDPYIYPALFSNEMNCVRVLKYLKDIPGELFSLDNICVFTNKDGNVGVICSFKYSFSSSFDNWRKAFFEAKVNIPDTFKVAYYDYVNALQNEEHKGIYISNVCVRDSLRGKGMGYKMLSQYLINQTVEEVELDVLKDNRRAINLYRRAGFIVDGEYDGFSLSGRKPRCYHMKRNDMDS